jgi:hypothetical protein
VNERLLHKDVKVSQKHIAVSRVVVNPQRRSERKRLMLKISINQKGIAYVRQTIKFETDNKYFNRLDRNLEYTDGSQNEETTIKHSIESGRITSFLILRVRL